MSVSEARVPTRDASRYLIRLCQHAGKMGGRLGHQPRRHRGVGGPPEIIKADWSDSAGTLVLSLGRCMLRAADDMLTIRVEASSTGDLSQMQDLITKRLESFGRRERLTVAWQPATDMTAGPGTGPDSVTSAAGDGPAPG